MTPWIYEQSTGMFYLSGVGKGIGYAGAGFGKNNPAAQEIHDVGPLPVGRYTILEPIDTRTHGPYVLWLEPAPTNQMFFRSGFGIHGDSIVAPGTASEGCIVTARATREKIWRSGIRTLDVVAYFTKETA